MTRTDRTVGSASCHNLSLGFWVSLAYFRLPLPLSWIFFIRHFHEAYHIRSKIQHENASFKEYKLINLQTKNYKKESPCICAQSHLLDSLSMILRFWLNLKFYDPCTKDRAESQSVKKKSLCIVPFASEHGFKLWSLRASWSAWKSYTSWWYAVNFNLTKEIYKK